MGASVHPMGVSVHPMGASIHPKTKSQLILNLAYASFDSLLSRDGLGHLGKGWIVRGTTTRILPYRAHGLFYPSWNRLYRITAYSSVADCQALTWHISSGCVFSFLKFGKFRIIFVYISVWGKKSLELYRETLLLSFFVCLRLASKFSASRFFFEITPPKWMKKPASTPQ